MYFGSDNSVGASPKIMAAIAEANQQGAEPSYGNDSYCKAATDKIREFFNHDAAVFFVPTGTAANALALAQLTQRWSCILAHQDSHITIDECNAVEMQTGGTRILGLPGEGGKIFPAVLAQTLKTLPRKRPHNAKPGALSLSQCTESGLVYTPDEISALTGIAKLENIAVHMDGSRFANAVATLGCTPAEITWKSGIDVLSLGATKNGALQAEAVVFFNPAQAENFDYLRKRAGHLVSKGRLLGAQFNAWLSDNHWLELAQHANSMATRLATGLQKIPGIKLAYTPQANEVFAILQRQGHEKLQTLGATYYEWQDSGLPDHLRPLPQSDVFVRLVTSWQTQPEQVDSFTAAVRQTHQP